MLQTEWVTTDGLAFDGPAHLRGLTVVSDGGGVADVTLYDGLNDDGQLLGTFKALSDDSRVCIQAPGIPVVMGLYVDVGSNLEGALLSWEPME
jgi:hypothetical protein